MNPCADYLGLTGSDMALVKATEERLAKRLAKHPNQPRLQALLWWVVWRGSIGQLRELITAGVDPNFVHDDGNHSLGLVLRWRSEKEGAAEFFHALLGAGADPSLRIGSKSLMSLACSQGTTAWAIAPLLDTGTVTRPDLAQALLAAANDALLTSRLIEAGADVNRIANAGVHASSRLTALMVACLHGNHLVVEQLLKAGADANMKDAHGHTALDHAMADAKPSRRIIAMLQQAGGVSAKNFPRHDEPARGFAAAARKPAYRNAVSFVQRVTGIKPSPLVGEDGRIPGGFGFSFKANPAPGALSPADFAAHTDAARVFVEQHQAEVTKQGGCLFYSRDLLEENGIVLALLPTTDVYRVMEVLETNSQESTEDLVRRLKALEAVQRFSIVGAGRDFVDGKFIEPINDTSEIAKRIHEMCPDEEPAKRQGECLLQPNRFYLWWD